jgi:hypothetical protein
LRVEFSDEAVGIVVVVVVAVQLEGFAIEYSCILDQDHTVEVALESLEFIVCSTMIVRQDRNTIVGLGSIGVSCVVY